MASDSTTLLGAMLSFSVLFFATLPRVHVWAQDQNIFVSPKYNPTDKTGIYAGDLQWALGSSQLIAFQSTWDGYRIELWQQSLPTGGAKISSNLVYNQNTNGKRLPQSFYWTVQTYELQLSDSPVFFLWLRENGNNPNAQQSSAYFNITVDTPVSFTTSTTTTSSPGVTILSATPPTESSSSTSTGPGAATTYSPASSSIATATPKSKGLSTGAAAGIGVGVAIVVSVITGFAYLGKRRRRRTQLQVELQGSGPPATSFLPGSPKRETIWANGYDQPRAELPG